MARYTGPKNRLARKEGIDLGLKTVGAKSHASLLRRLNIPPGQHGPKLRRKMSGYGTQLREKQKMKKMYGILERQFRRYFAMARKWRGNTGDMLVQFLERRLDNTLFRMGVAPTRTSARQFVSRHVNHTRQARDHPDPPLRPAAAHHRSVAGRSQAGRAEGLLRDDLRPGAGRRRACRHARAGPREPDPEPCRGADAEDPAPGVDSRHQSLAARPLHQLGTAACPARTESIRSGQAGPPHCPHAVPASTSAKGSSSGCSRTADSVRTRRRSGSPPRCGSPRRSAGGFPSCWPVRSARATPGAGSGAVLRAVGGRDPRRCGAPGRRW